MCLLPDAYACRVSGRSFNVCHKLTLTCLRTRLREWWYDATNGDACVMMASDSIHFVLLSLLRTVHSLFVLLSSFDSSYLVDPASSHMLVSKIKPCMSKYKHLYTVKLRTAHYISYYLFDGTLLHGYP